MSDTPKPGTLCERCSLLSFDDLAIGGQEVVGEDGVARLSFLESKIEFRPENWQEYRDHDHDAPIHRLIRLDWELDEIFPDMPHLSRSSQLGCVFCRSLRRSLEETFAKEAESYGIKAGAMNLIAYLALVDDGVGALVVEATFNHATLNRAIAYQTVSPIEADSNCGKWLRTHPVRDASYLSSTSIRKMRQVLDYCTSKCHPFTPSSFMPTRLIDVGDDACANSRLVLSSTINRSQQPKYAALSYCWGSEKDAESQFKTEKASLERRCVGLPGRLTTPAISDAIAFTRAIGLRYLWIDALCIIQDDEEDWLHESSRMNLVYRHAYVTLCNLNSDSCHENFLSRAPSVEIPFQSTIREAIKGSYLIRLRPRADGLLYRDRYIWDSTLSNWNKRCWTFQEREMSTRLLMFGSLRMHFACPRSEWSEGDEAPRDRDKSRPAVSDMITRFKDKCISYQELYDYWDWVVHNYGQRSVTSSKDRLPAIAGLARMFGEALQNRYLAGLWQDDLLCGLTWVSYGHVVSRGLEAHIRDVRERDYVAPSWSWAACASSSPENRYSGILSEEVVIVDANTDPSSDDPYGQVSGGVLRIRGKRARLPIWLKEKEETLWLNYWIHHLTKTETYDDCIYIRTDWLHKDKEAELEDVVVMLLYRTENEDGARAPALQALLLYPADELQNYYRVGTIRSEGPTGYSEMTGWFKDSQEETICII